MYDLIVKAGRIVDGTGAPAFTGDIAVTEGRIVGVLSVHSYTAGIYNTEHAQFLGTVASQVAGCTATIAA